MFDSKVAAQGIVENNVLLSTEEDEDYAEELN